MQENKTLNQADSNPEDTIYQGNKMTVKFPGKISMNNLGKVEFNCVDHDAIKELRSTNDPERKKQLKMSFPQAIICGVFAPKRCSANS